MFNRSDLKQNQFSKSTKKTQTNVSAALIGVLRPMAAFTEAEAMRPAMIVSYNVTIVKCILNMVCQLVRPWQITRGLWELAQFKHNDKSDRNNMDIRLRRRRNHRQIYHTIQNSDPQRCEIAVVLSVNTVSYHVVFAVATRASI